LDAAFESFAQRLETTMDRLAAQLDRIDNGPTPLVFTPEEAGQVLGVSEDTVRRWVRAGHLPRLPHTDRVLIPRKAVEGFVHDVAAIEVRATSGVVTFAKADRSATSPGSRR
jgi:excisionase family DNA binding protein